MLLRITLHSPFEFKRNPMHSFGLEPELVAIEVTVGKEMVERLVAVVSGVAEARIESTYFLPAGWFGHARSLRTGFFFRRRRVVRRLNRDLHKFPFLQERV